MGRENNAICAYLNDNRRFADLFNVTFFHGKQIVKPEDLENISEKYVEKPATRNSTQKTTERIRDIQKRMKSGAILRILSVESQTHVDYTMPWRCMNYDSLEYGKQIKEIKGRNNTAGIFSSTAERLCGFLKSDRLIPVYTICLYHGRETWDGPKSLQDMMDFGEDSEQWRSLFADYQFRLVCMNEPSNFSQFQTSLGLLFAVLPLRKNTTELKRLITETPAFQKLDKDTMEVIAVMTNNSKVLDEMESYENEGGYNMCEALEGIKEEGAMTKLIELVCKKLTKNKPMETIVDELEEERDTIQTICKVATSFAPDYDIDKIYEAWKLQNNSSSPASE